MKDEGVPLRRIRSNSWHARETVNRPGAVATNKKRLLPRRRDGEAAGTDGRFFSSLLKDAILLPSEHFK
jgi:hypothetical protein